MPPDSHETDHEMSRSLAAERELQSFSYMISHDFAASLRHVSEFSRLLLGDLPGALTPRQESHAAHIRSATANCQQMMDELLAYSRVQQRALAMTRQDAMACLDLPLLQLAVQAEAIGAEVRVEPLGEVCADPELLALAVHHLLDNAIKFRRADVTPRIAIQAAHDAKFWRMHVVDNGLGIAPEYREKAFQMFSRLNGEGAYPGVGAGLAICRRIARRHGGEVTFLDSAEGACVELSLPRGPAH
jgi:signal transduction histidine kinase